MDCEKKEGADEDETKNEFKLEAEMKGLGMPGSKDTEVDLPPGEHHQEELVKDGGAKAEDDKPAPSGGPGWAWVECEKYAEVQAKSEHLQKLLSEANRKLEEKEEENKKLRGRWARFRTVYPTVERRLGEILELKKEAKVTSKLVEELVPTTDPIVEEILRKEEEVARLTRRINKLKLRSQGHGDEVDKMALDPRIIPEKEAVSIFPEEVWRVILGNLTDHKDRWNCSNTCTLFKRILHDWKLPTLLFHQVFPYLFQQLPQNRILELRLVSKGWGRVVGHFMEQQPSLQIQSPDSGLLSLLFPQVGQKFYALNRFNFTTEYMPWNPEEPGFPYVPGRNPFLGRVVTLTFNPMMVTSKDYGRLGGTDEGLDNDDEEGSIDLEDMITPWENIYSFLRKFGKYIWDLTLDSSDEEAPDEIYYNYDYSPDDYNAKMVKFMTVDLASLVPDLRKLRILPRDFEGEEDMDYDYDFPDSFQMMPNLESVEAARPGVGLRLVPELIRRHHSNLRTLHLTGIMWEEVWEAGLDWPNLTELHLDHLQYPDQLRMLFSTNTEGCSPGIYSLGSAGMPRLRKLGVNLKGMEKGLDLLLLAVHKLFATTQLTTLRIGGFSEVCELFQQAWWPWCMSPTLKTLEVEHECEEEIYFLVHFPLVENVHVFSTAYSAVAVEARRSRSPSYGYDKQEGVLDMNDYIDDGRMYESNIWELLPRLKLFTFKLDKFTRAGYEEFMEKAVLLRRDS